MSFNWLGKAGRKYSIQLFLIISSTFAMFFNYCSFVEWSVYTASIFGGYAVMNHQAKKLEK